MAKPTIRDVARDAGVGVGTVSRVLNEDRHVRSATRERVLEAVRRLGFRPNRAARGLVRGRTDTIGILVPFFTRHYVLEILRGIEQSASASDYSLIVYNVERSEQALAHLTFLSRTPRVDGLIVVSLSGSLVARAYGNTPPFPLVGIDTRIAGQTSLLPDHAAGMYLAARHLADLGHRRIALVDRFQDPVVRTIGRARRNGFRKACQEFGIGVPESPVVIGDYSPEGGCEAARQLLRLSPAPTALACASDLQALGAMRAVEEAGLTVGRDVSVTGYHDVELAQYLRLTTVRVPASPMGELAATLLADALAGRWTEARTVHFAPELVVRGTSGPAPRSSRNRSRRSSPPAGALEPRGARG